MKEQLKELLKENQLQGILISGSREHNPFLTYFVGDAFFTDADVLLPQDGEPILFYRPMERDTAFSTGLKCVCYNQLPECKTRAESLKCMLTHAGITSGKVAFSGRIEFGEAFEAVSKLKELLPELEICGSEGDKILQKVRCTKDAKEVAAIKRMSGIVTTVVERVENYISSGVLKQGKLYNAEGCSVTIGKIKALINLWLGELGAENPEGTIFAQGRDAGVPHNAGNDNEVLEEGKSIVYDFFPCENGGGYFSDFTRTWCIGYAPEVVEKGYQQVKEIHDACVEAIRPGMSFNDIQILTCEYFQKLGHPTVLEDRLTEKGYVHSIGHGLGLNIHETPFSGFSAREEDVLVPGSVFTIEPGLYYPDEGYGIRIEDTYTMNADGTIQKLTEYPYRLVLPVKREE